MYVVFAVLFSTQISFYSFASKVWKDFWMIFNAMEMCLTFDEKKKTAIKLKSHWHRSTKTDSFSCCRLQRDDVGWWWRKKNAMKLSHYRCLLTYNKYSVENWKNENHCNAKVNAMFDWAFSLTFNRIVFSLFFFYSLIFSH